MRRSPVEDLYAPLSDYLTRQAAAGQERVELPFAQIEAAILGHPLPPWARRSRDWWRNDGRQQHAWYGWVRVGWFVGAVSLATETVTFTRGADSGAVKWGMQSPLHRGPLSGSPSADTAPPRA